jgi:catechol-2,3-dioxygenase
MEMKFTGICLITNSVPVLTKFYTKVLGVEAEGDDVHTELKTEGANISIFSTEGMEGMAPLSRKF